MVTYYKFCDNKKYREIMDLVFAFPRELFSALPLLKMIIRRGVPVYAAIFLPLDKLNYRIYREQLPSFSKITNCKDNLNKKIK